jgi:hypothetical protein
MEAHTLSRLWTPEIAAHYEKLYESKAGRCSLTLSN